jgi:hypothetical protein
LEFEILSPFFFPLKEDKRTLLQKGSLLEEDEAKAAPPPKNQRNLRELGRKRRNKNRDGCNLDTEFHIGSRIHLGLGRCAGICVEGRNGVTTQERCNSNDNNQKFTIQKASGGAMGFYVIADGGVCLQPEECGGGADSPVIIGSCGIDKARWAPAGGGMLYNIGCYESGNVADDVGALSPDLPCFEGSGVTVELGGDVSNQVILFLSECAARTVNGFS